MKRADRVKRNADLEIPKPQRVVVIKPKPQVHISDNEVIRAFRRAKRDPYKTAEMVNKSLVWVYRKIKQLELQTQTRYRMAHPDDGELKLVYSFGPDASLHEVAEAHRRSPVQIRYIIMKAVSKMWGQEMHPHFPMPYTLIDLRVFNVMRQISPEKRLSDGTLAIEDVAYVARRAKAVIEKVELYHTRYMTLQVAIEEGKTHDRHSSKSSNRIKGKRGWSHA